MPSLPELSRRRLLTVAGVGAAAAATPLVSLRGGSPAVAATTGVACSTETDEQEVGPFYVAEGLVRSDITSGEDGIPLAFTITVTDADTCEPLVGAAVDVWHASALGVYSDESSESTVGETFLRGIQITDSDGSVTFTSIYPGWYAGRTNHIHTRIYTGGSVSGSGFDYSDATLVWTGQMFFDPAVNTTVAAVSPYSTNTVTRTTNATDRVYTTQNGSAVLTALSGNTTDGYTSTVAYAVSTSGSTSGKDATKLTLAASSTELAAGKELTLSGKLTDSTTSTGLSGETIVLKATMPSGKKSHGSLTTGAGGAWSVAFAPGTSATYKASYAGSSSYAAAASDHVGVQLDFRVTVSDVLVPKHVSKPVAISGAVVPAAKGRRVTIHKIVDGTRHTIGRVSTASDGTWSTTWSAGKGKHHVVATVAATKNYGAGASRKITVTR